MRTAVLVGAVSALVAGSIAFAALHEPNPRTLPDGLVYITCPAEDEHMAPLLWAAGAYIVTFTPTLFLLQGRTTKNVFAP